MKELLKLKAASVVGILGILTFYCSSTFGAGYIALTIRNSSEALSAGDVCESMVSYSASDVVLGAYLLTIKFDPAQVKINTIVVPDNSEFFDQIFFNTESFNSGVTKIGGFQTEISSEQQHEPILFTIQWEALASCSISDTTELIVESMIDSSWRPVDTVYNPSRQLFISNTNKQKRRYLPLNKLCRLGAVNKFDIEFSKDVKISKDDLIIEGQHIGYIDLSESKFKYENKFATWILPITLPDDVYSIRLKKPKDIIINDK